MMPVSEDTDMAISFTISVGLLSSLQAVQKRQMNVNRGMINLFMVIQFLYGLNRGLRFGIQKREPIMPFFKYETGIAFLLFLSHAYRFGRIFLTRLQR